MKHIIHSGLQDRPIKVTLIGAGGTGSQLLSGLGRLHLSLLSLGHPHGLDVTVYDPDTVSVSNVGRQLFAQSDVGLNKGIVLVNRLNQYYGLNWKAIPKRFAGEYQMNEDIYITCVDTKESRRVIHNAFAKANSYKKTYWLDIGNRLTDGQVCIGEPIFANTPKKSHKDYNPLRLPTITELYSEILDESIPEPEDMPTCSLAEALEKQDLFVCQSVATFALQMLWQLLRNGGIDFSAQFINLQSGRVTPLPVDVKAWERFGVIRGKSKKPVKSKGAK